MDLGLQGKVALVAASSRGLGRAVAEELGAEGARLVICARGAAALREAEAAIRDATGTPVLAVPTDLSDAAAVERLVSAGVERFGPIDILVSNTGGPPAGTFDQLAPEVWHDAVRQNLDSVLNLTRAVLPGMTERRWGRILNITSIAVKQPVDNLILSNAVRAAVTGMARTLATEVAPLGITVNNVLPGYTATQRVTDLAARIATDKGVSAREVVGGWEAEIPMGRLGAPREFAALVAFLASDRAGYITGTSIPADGGWIRSLF